MIGIAPLPRGEDLPVSVANQGGIVSGKAQSLMANREPWYAHSDRAIPYNPELLRYARENRKA